MHFEDNFLGAHTEGERYRYNKSKQSSKHGFFPFEIFC